MKRLDKVIDELAELIDVLEEKADFTKAFDEVLKRSKDVRNALYGNAFKQLYEGVEDESTIKFFDIIKYWEAILAGFGGYKSVDETYKYFETKENTDTIKTIVKELGFDGVEWYGMEEKNHAGELRLRVYKEGCEM